MARPHDSLEKKEEKTIAGRCSLQGKVAEAGMFLIFGERLGKPGSSGSSRDFGPISQHNIYFLFYYTEPLRSRQ